MAVLLFKLNGVPEDEADEVRALLTEHGIAFYETSAGRFGISLAAIWLRDDAQLADARRLIDAYQCDRVQRVRGEYEALRRAGEHETLWDRFRLSPLRFIAYVAVILLVLYFSLAPFLLH
jgi:hypothetical protein